MPKILLLEDDADLRCELAEALSEEAFAVRHAGAVQAFWQEFRRFSPDAVVLDMTLPDGGGLGVARKIRAESSMPILFLSGRRDETDRIVALELGADDFVVKPCSPRELIARVNAVLRRCAPEARLPAGPAALGFAGFRLDPAAMELRDAAGAPVALTTAEFNLLRIFAERPRRVLSRGTLLDLLRGEDWAGYERMVDGLVSRLRKKLSAAGASEPMLKTVHGAGYIFAADVAAAD